MKENTIISQNEKEIISVIIPVHNGVKWIKKTVNSIMRQTYPNLEIILVENNSKDNSWNVCNTLSKKINTLKQFKVKNMELRWLEKRVYRYQWENI